MEHQDYKDSRSERLKMASLGFLIIITSCTTTINIINTNKMTKKKVKKAQESRKQPEAKTPYNFVPLTQQEISEGESLTVEGESFTIRELFQRHAEGQMPIASPEKYDDQDVTLEDTPMENPDISDAYEIAENLKTKADKKPEKETEKLKEETQEKIEEKTEETTVKKEES